VSLTTVLLDLGGVLTPDPWQALLLAPGRGLVDRLGLDRAAVVAAADELWQYHARHRTTEEDWWAGLAARAGRPIPPAAVDRAERELLGLLPGARDALDALAGAGVPWGLVTNTTDFWYARQRALLGLAPGEPAWAFVSSVEGCEKGDRPGLFERAARVVDPAATLVVDDRPDNLARAAEVGFGTERHPGVPGVPLLATLRRRVPALRAG